MTDYFEATLQLRNMREEIMDFVNSEINAKSIKVAKTAKQRNGIDLYLPSRKFAATLARKLCEKFGGEMEITTRLFGVSRMGKTLYRVAVLYTASDYKPGDIIEIGNKIILLKSIGKFAAGHDLTSGKNAKIEMKGKDIRKLEKFSTHVTKNYPHLEVLHPETYDSVPVLNPRSMKKNKVNVVVSEKGVYIAD